MKIKVKVKDSRKKYVKNGGIHLLRTFVPRNEVVEVELKDNEEFIFKSAEFTHWFDLVEYDSGLDDELVDDELVDDELVDDDELEETQQTDEEFIQAPEDVGVDFVATEDHTILELRDYCKAVGFKDYTPLSKGELIEAINAGILEKK